MRGILAATDGSAGGDRAVDFAAAMAGKFAAELVLLNVEPEMDPRALSHDTRALDPDLKGLLEAERISLNEFLDDASRGILEKAKARAEAAGAARIVTLSRSGDPAEIILTTAEEHGCDAIVMGKRGHGRLFGLLLGSVSQKVTTMARCTVIVVP